MYNLLILLGAGSKMGWFGYDKFLQNGYAESQGYTVYRKDFWDANRDTEIRKYRQRYSPKGHLWIQPTSTKLDYRRLLGLPETGELLKSEIEQAFRVHARNVHPDHEGSHEDFQKLGTAKEALLRSLKTL
jgi:hypothetical protein